MGYFLVRYDSRVIIYDCKIFIILATGVVHEQGDQKVGEKSGTKIAKADLLEKCAMGNVNKVAQTAINSPIWSHCLCIKNTTSSFAAFK